MVVVVKMFDRSEPEFRQATNHTWTCWIFVTVVDPSTSSFFVGFFQTWNQFGEMDPTSDTLVEKELRRLLAKAEQENDILRVENDKLWRLHSRAEEEHQRLLSRADEELAIVRSSRDKFRRLFSEAEGKILEQKLAFLDLENDYEREKTKRINLVG